MTSFGGAVRICDQEDGCARVEFLVPDSEDLSGNTGLCGNANGNADDDPDASTGFGVSSLTLINSEDDDDDDSM